MDYATSPDSFAQHDGFHNGFDALCDVAAAFFSKLQL